MNVIRVLLVDDHEVVRLGLRSLLSKFNHIQVCAEAANADEAIRQYKIVMPDIVLMDVKMPGKTGFQACSEIIMQWSNANIVMLTSYDDEESIMESIRAGAKGYVLKEIGSADIIRAVETVAQGQFLLDPAITAKIMNKLRQPQDRKIESLTVQEREILACIAKGMSNKEIAKVVILSEKTVRNYVSLILDKLELHNRSEAAVFAVRHQLDK